MAVAKEDLPAYAALMVVQEELKACKGQSARDKAGNKLYEYRSAEDILEAVKPICKAHGLCIHMKGESVKTDEITKEVRMISEISVVDIASGGEIGSHFELAIGIPQRMGLGQWYGAVASYARKYCMCALFGIDNSKDIDLDSDVVRGMNSGNNRNNAHTAEQAKIDKALIETTSQQGQDNMKKNIIRQLQNKAKSRNADNDVIKKIIKHLGFENSDNMTANQLIDVVNNFDKLLKEVQ